MTESRPSSLPSCRAPRRSHLSLGVPLASLLTVPLALGLAVPAVRAGCGAAAPTLVAAPQIMPQNGALALLLSHPLWHSRSAASGSGSGVDRLPLGRSAEDLPFVLTRNGAPEPLRLLATRPAPRGQTLVEIAPAAGWLPAASYELRTDVGTQRTYPAFTTAGAVAADTQPPTWAEGQPTAKVIHPPPPAPPPEPKHTKARCVTTGRGKNRTTTCEGETFTLTASTHCPPDVTESHVALRLPALQDDHGGTLTLEIRTGDTTAWIPAARELTLGLSAACDPPNFPAPPATPYDLEITPLDAAKNRGPTLRVRVTPHPRPR